MYDYQIWYPFVKDIIPLIEIIKIPQKDVKILENVCKIANGRGG